MVKLKPPTPILSFRSAPELGGKHYIQVLVFRTERESWRYVRSFRPTAPEFYGYVRELGRAHGGCLGELIISRRHCTPLNVIHEMVHAAILWAHAVHLNPGLMVRWGDNQNERFAEAVAQLVSGFWKGVSRCSSTSSRKTNTNASPRASRDISPTCNPNCREVN